VDVVVTWSQISREIDHSRAGGASSGDPWRRGAVRQRAEHELGVAQRGVFDPDVRHGPAANMRALPSAFVRRGPGYFEPAMAGGECTQLASCVPTGPQHPDRDFMHG
jgi:hypothetical protein